MAITVQFHSQSGDEICIYTKQIYDDLEQQHNTSGSQ